MLNNFWSKELLTCNKSKWNTYNFTFTGANYVTFSNEKITLDNASYEVCLVSSELDKTTSIMKLAWDSYKQFADIPLDGTVTQFTVGTSGDAVIMIDANVSGNVTIKLRKI